jgi:hypothetical protein
LERAFKGVLICIFSSLLGAWHNLAPILPQVKKALRSRKTFPHAKAQRSQRVFLPTLKQGPGIEPDIYLGEGDARRFSWRSLRLCVRKIADRFPIKRRTGCLWGKGMNVGCKYEKENIVKDKGLTSDSWVIFRKNIIN